MKSREGWKWYGFPGHHCCGSRCQYHLSTNIGNKVLVSTVGRFVPDPLRNPEKTDTVGTGRDFETMVFKIDGEDENGDPKVVDWSEALDSDGYNSSLHAESGHYAMCEKWAEMSNVEVTGKPQRCAAGAR